MAKKLTPAQARYVEYLKTPHWQQLRARILARADEHCEWCGRFCGRNPHPGGNPHLRCGDEHCRWCAFYIDEETGRTEAEQQSLEVHHVSYERRGAERDDDVVALCWTCHEGITERLQLLAQLYRTGQIPKALVSHDVAANTFWRAVFTAAGFKVHP